MPNLNQQRAELFKLDQDIAECEHRVTEQVLWIGEMIARGEDPTDAQETLQVMNESLALWREHRQSILDAIARPTAGSG
jgi:hypothetical protein